MLVRVNLAECPGLARAARTVVLETVEAMGPREVAPGMMAFPPVVPRHIPPMGWSAVPSRPTVSQAAPRAAAPRWVQQTHQPVGVQLTTFA